MRVKTQLYLLLALIVICAITVAAIVFLPQMNQSSSGVNAVIGTTPVNKSQSIQVVSDISGISVSSVSMQNLQNVLGQVSYFKPNAALVGQDGGNQQAGTVTNLTIHLTDKPQPLGKAYLDKSQSEQKVNPYMSYGEKYDSATQSQDLLIYINPANVISDDASTLSAKYWNATLIAIFWQTPIGQKETMAQHNSAFNAFMKSGYTIMGFSLKRT